MPVVTVDFLGISRVLNKSLASDPVEDPSIYRVTRNRTAEVFVSCVSARAPELRRPRFSFLYDQLVKEPSSGNRPSAGGGQAPHFI